MNSLATSQGCQLIGQGYKTHEMLTVNYFHYAFTWKRKTQAQGVSNQVAEKDTWDDKTGRNREAKRRHFCGLFDNIVSVQTTWSRMEG
jgi:hypothetical protein